MTALRLVLPTALLALAWPITAATIDLEDVGATLPFMGNDFYDGSDGAGGFTSGGAHFNNVNPGGFWGGFSFSQTTDTTTPGFGNQYSAVTGSGAGGSATYAVGYHDTFTPTVPTITFASPMNPIGVEITNTTYAALAMRDGDAFSDPFGTPDDPSDPAGSFPDWLLLTITGFDAGGDATGFVDLYLADYRFDDDGLDYIVDTWTHVDLTGLGTVESLTFELSGSDDNGFGLATPAYFALDDLVVPEPGTGALLALGLAGLARRRAAS